MRRNVVRVGRLGCAIILITASAIGAGCGDADKDAAVAVAMAYMDARTAGDFDAALPLYDPSVLENPGASDSLRTQMQRARESVGTVESIKVSRVRCGRGAIGTYTTITFQVIGERYSGAEYVWLIKWSGTEKTWLLDKPLFGTRGQARPRRVA